MYTTRATLLEKIAAGNEVSWSEFYDTYKSLILSEARKRGVPESDRDDIVQKTMLGVFHDGVFTYRRQKDGKFRSWLGSIIRNKIADYFREAERRNTVVSTGLPEGRDWDDFEAGFLEEYRTHLLRLAMEELKARVDPEIFETFALCRTGCSDTEAARKLGLRSNTVTIRKRRCVEILNGIIRSLNQSDPDLNLPIL
ncbi:MAG: sigma-70 family RNA polymerase sigma factor [Lentisphaeria bacterium]|nr:sigma-70 family RNA polymerase sigma factor [Lentisphaeria bacterium]